MTRQWVTQEILAAESDDAEWDCWILGTIEDDAFNERCRTFDKADAEFLITAARWFETFQEGTIKPAVVVRKKAKARAK